MLRVQASTSKPMEIQFTTRIFKEGRTFAGHAQEPLVIPKYAAVPVFIYQKQSPEGRLQDCLPYHADAAALELTTVPWNAPVRLSLD